MTDARQHITISLPLYQWLMLAGALSGLPDQSWYSAMIDQILEATGP